jgi:hypothetical protein
MSINAISYLTGNTAYQTGMFKRGPVGINMSTTLTGNYNWWGKVNAAATQFLIYTDSYTTNRTSQANAIPTAWSTPDLTDQSLINVINTIPERIGEPLFTTVTQAVNWLNQTNKYFLTKNEYENIVTSNLTLNLDPAWYTSYSGTGTAWNDISGNNSNFTLINGVGFSTIGQGSLSFDGTDDISTGNVSNINSTAGQYNTVTFWMYWAGNSGGFPFELGGYRLWTPGTNFGFNTGNGDIYGIDGTPLINTWVHVSAVFYNGAYTGNNKLYINGVLQTLTQRLGSASSGTASAAVAIGGYGGAYTSYPFQGKIGPFQIYNVQLTQAQILQNFNSQSYRFGVNNNVVTSGLLLYLDANDKLSYPGTGTVWYDLSGNNANGTLINSPTWNSNGYFTFDAIDDVIDGINVPQDYIDLHIQMYSDGGNGTGLEMVVSKFDDADKSFRTSGGIFRHNNGGGDGNDWNYLNTQYDYVDGNFLTTDYNLTGDWHFVRLARANPTFDPPFVYSLSSNFLSRGYLGKIRKVLMYNRTLSPSEVAQNYYQGNIVTSGLQLMLDAGNIVSYPTTGTTWVDLTNNKNNASAPNGITYNTSVGGNLYFDGTDEFFNINPTTNIRLNGNYSTVSMWCYIRSVGPNGYAELYSVWGGNRTGIKWQTDLIGMDANGDFYNVNVPMTNAYNQWMNITCVIDRVNSVFKVYKNGVFVGSDTFTSYSATSTNVSIGGTTLTGNAGDVIKGSISNVMVYNVELDLTQISNNFNAQKNRYGL